MPEIVSVPHHPSGMGDLFPRQLAGTAEMWPTPPGRLHPSLRALGNQGALKCGAGSHDMKHQLAPGRGRVDRFRARLEAHPLHPQGMHQTHQVRHRATEPIQPPDHQHIAWGERRQRGIQPGTLHLRTREPRVVENPRAAGGGATGRPWTRVHTRWAYAASSVVCVRPSAPFAPAFCNIHARTKSRRATSPFLCGERGAFGYSTRGSSKVWSA